MTDSFIEFGLAKYWERCPCGHYWEESDWSVEEGDGPHTGTTRYKCPRCQGRLILSERRGETTAMQFRWSISQD